MRLGYPQLELSTVTINGVKMAKIKSLEEVLEDQLKDLYSAENQLLKALPKMAKKASSETLRGAFQTHLEETQNQVERLQSIGESLEMKLTGKVCKAMQGLIEEGKEAMEEESDNPALIDLMLIAAAQRVEHYEISAYGNARAIAEALGKTEVAQELQEILDEESATDEKLTEITQDEIMAEAQSGSEEEEDEDEEDSRAMKSQAGSRKKGSSSESRAK